MIEFALLATLVSSAAAFALAFESKLGAQSPLGIYDPLCFLDRVDQETIDRLCYIELKHGQICQLAFISQLAFLGQITTRAGLHLPGDINRGSHASASAAQPSTAWKPSAPQASSRSRPSLPSSRSTS